MTKPLVTMIALCLLGCPVAAQKKVKTKTIELTIVSDPPGASIVLPFTAVAPLTIKQQVPVDCRDFAATVVRWQSGAEATLAPTHLCPTPKRQTLVFRRPTGVEGLALDVQYGLRWLELLQREDAMRQQAILGILAGIHAEPFVLPPPPSPQPAPLNVTCQSVLVGNVVQTTCR